MADALNRPKVVSGIGCTYDPCPSGIPNDPSLSRVTCLAGVLAPDPERSERGGVANGIDEPRLVTRRLEELCKHPSYIGHGLAVPAAQLSSLMTQGTRPFSQPISITRCGIIIDGYARYELAHRQGRQTILCLEYNLDEQEALRWLIQSHAPSKGLNGLSRSLLALDLEQPLQEAARANQREGGRSKGSSSLTEPQTVDVRSKVAAIACVSSGNVTKAKQVLKYAHPIIQEAVKAGEISLHKAWQWSGLSPQGQTKNLEELRSRKGTNQTSRRLIQKHVARMSPTRLLPSTLSDVLKPFIPDGLAKLSSIVVSEIDASGQIAYFTKEALRTLRTTERHG
jgi:hypothetical protein